ncbi:MAG TPA: hypothetical protein VIO36_16230 [Anaerolineaceae bacterium]
MDPAIVLFDLDGVLVRPGGYRAAVVGSMQELLARMELDAPPPTRLVCALFESIGITSEWDMVPVALAIVLNAVARHAKTPLPAVSLPDVMAWIRERRLTNVQVDYENSVRALQGLVTTRVTPALFLYHRILSGDLQHIFPHLGNQPFLRDLLADTRNPAQSVTMRLVQSHVLGREVFEQTYEIPAEISVDSTLLALDHPALEPDLGHRLLARHAAGSMRLCAFTARPSLPPRDGGFSRKGFSPEAELALRLIGFQDIPLMGYGRLIAFGDRYAVSPDSILKPAPLQSLAAAVAAVTGQEWAALEWAREYLDNVNRGGLLHLPQGFPRKFELHVFEDASVGIRGGQAAAELFRLCGAEVTYHPWGIATIADKEAALVAAGAPVFPDVNHALRAAFPDL